MVVVVVIKVAAPQRHCSLRKREKSPLPRIPYWFSYRDVFSALQLQSMRTLYAYIDCNNDMALVSTRNSTIVKQRQIAMRMHISAGL